MNIKHYGDPIPLDASEGMDILKKVFIDIRDNISTTEIEVLQKELNDVKLINEKLLLHLQG